VLGLDEFDGFLLRLFLELLVIILYFTVGKWVLTLVSSTHLQSVGAIEAVGDMDADVPYAKTSCLLLVPSKIL